MLLEGNNLLEPHSLHTQTGSAPDVQPDLNVPFRTTCLFDMIPTRITQKVGAWVKSVGTPKPPAPPEQEGAQPPAEAETTPGVDEARGNTEPPVAGSAGPGYGNSAEPEAAPPSRRCKTTATDIAQAHHASRVGGHSFARPNPGASLNSLPGRQGCSKTGISGWRYRIQDRP